MESSFDLARRAAVCALLAWAGMMALAAAPGITASGQTAWGAPPGFRPVMYAAGLALFRNGPEFVQVINLKQGASLELWHGAIMDERKGQGVYGGNDPQIWRQPLWQIWHDFSASNPNAFCVTNGQFFSSTLENPTTLAFPLKKDGVLVSDGYDINRHPDKKLILEIWENKVNIIPLNQANLRSSSAPHLIAGLAQDAGRRGGQALSRTMVGIDDRDGDRQYETVLIFNSPAATAWRAADVLEKFGADKVIMLDGGDSTQLMCRGLPYLQSPSSREIPQAIAVASGRGPALTPPPGCYATYAVQRNETLASIASYYSASALEIAQINGLANPRLIFSGQTLCIP